MPRNRPHQPSHASSSEDLKRFANQHWQACQLSWKRLQTSKLASLITIGVIALTLVLPSLLFVLLQNTKSLVAMWNSDTQISLYLHVGTTPEKVDNLLNTYRADPLILRAEYISPEEGLAEFEKKTGVTQVLDKLPANPIPPVILLNPVKSLNNPALISALLLHVKDNPEVESAELDREWLQKLSGIIEIGQKALYAFLFLLSAAVILIIGNTIHLSLQSHYQEIEVIQWIGATQAYIRRPFLYSGLWYGIFAGLLAWCLNSLFILWLNAPFKKLMRLFDSAFYLVGLELSQGLILISVSSLLGMLGAWLAVTRHLVQLPSSHRLAA